MEQEQKVIPIEGREIEPYKQEFDTIINLSGARVTIAILGRRIDIEPYHKTARVFLDEPEGVGTLVSDDLKIPVKVFGTPFLANLPNPKEGVIYIVRPEVARHPRVRRRPDVFYPYAQTANGTCEALARYG
jgi:hypothetical protein